MSLSSSERRAANWSTDRTSADTPTHVVGLCRKSTTALLAVRVYIVVGNEVMTQQQRPSHFACLFEASVRFFTYFCCGKLENHSYHEFTHDSLLQGACLNETSALERTFTLLWQRWMFWTETDAAFGALLAPVLSRGTTKLPYCLLTMKQTRSQSWIQSWVLTAADLHYGRAETSGGASRFSHSRVGARGVLVVFV